MGEHYPKQRRLCKKSHYQQVFRKPRRFFAKNLIALTTLNKLTYSRLGIVIKKRVNKHAVTRNLAKRIIRQQFRTQQTLGLIGVDIVIIVKRPVDKRELATHLIALWKQIITAYKKY